MGASMDLLFQHFEFLKPYVCSLFSPQQFDPEPNLSLSFTLSCHCVLLLTWIVLLGYLTNFVSQHILQSNHISFLLQLVLQANIGRGEHSDIAIDDFKFYKGRCLQGYSRPERPAAHKNKYKTSCEKKLPSFIHSFFIILSVKKGRRELTLCVCVLQTSFKEYQGASHLGN